MAEREGLEFESQIESDCAPLNGVVQAMLDDGLELHCLRDLTRGGLTSALVEIAESANRQIQIEETAIPVREDVKGACEILGLDPMYLANEGRFIAFLPATQAERALKIIKSHSRDANASLIGTVTNIAQPLVMLKSRIGAMRIVDMFSGEQLPRIC